MDRGGVGEGIGGRRRGGQEGGAAEVDMMEASRRWIGGRLEEVGVEEVDMMEA